MSTIILPTYSLTLKRPWPYAIARLEKRVENRSWTPPPALIGQRLAIHAGGNWDAAGAEWIFAGERPLPKESGQEGIVAVVTLAGWIAEGVVSGRVERFRLTGMDQKLGEKARASVWVLTEVDVLRKPVPCSGFQRLWKLKPDTLGLLAEALRSAERVAP